MKQLLFALAIMFTTVVTQAKTLIVYYSYTNNVERIVNELLTQIEADVIEVEPAEKGLDYAANNYAVGSSQIAAIRENPSDASSYPAIDPVSVDISQYSTIIIGAPLWWSNMAAPLQTFLFQHGKEMAGKNIGLIVSSASSGISGVESDAKRLIPNGKFLSPSLWIRSSQTSNAKSLLQDWLQTIDYSNLTSGIESIGQDNNGSITVYSLSGVKLLADAESTATIPAGLYIINGKKTFVTR
ncbi:flavodoxin [Bacteroides acidifaciens]|uniref:flavodoxin n=1 Tax=Bacteroides acidifaciens TaxID=85831 RepID=UPI00263AFF12|nr:flavodoxin [Bacteroides acidifaciens]